MQHSKINGHTGAMALSKVRGHTGAMVLSKISDHTGAMVLSETHLSYSLVQTISSAHTSHAKTLTMAAS